jgi:hypothetical protein
MARESEKNITLPKYSEMTGNNFMATGLEFRSQEEKANFHFEKYTEKWG